MAQITLSQSISNIISMWYDHNVSKDDCKSMLQFQLMQHNGLPLLHACCYVRFITVKYYAICTTFFVGVSRFSVTMKHLNNYRRICYNPFYIYGYPTFHGNITYL